MAPPSFYRPKLLHLFHEDFEKFGIELDKIVTKKVQQIASRWPASINEDGERWDEHTRAVLKQEVLEKHLLSKDNQKLNSLMTEAETITSDAEMEGFLEDRVGWYVKRVLVDRTANRTADKDIERLVRRIRKLAKDKHFKTKQITGQTYYARAGATTITAVQITEDDIRAAIRSVRAVPIVPMKSAAQRESKIYTSENLIRVVECILNVIKCISETHIREILKEVLTFYIAKRLPIDEESEGKPLTDQARILTIDIKPQLAKFVNKLEKRELEVVVFASVVDTHVAIAAETGFVRQTIAEKFKIWKKDLDPILGQLNQEDSYPVVMRLLIDLATERLNELEAES